MFSTDLPSPLTDAKYWHKTEFLPAPWQCFWISVHSNVFHRASQNHRIRWVGRDPLGSSKSNSWPYTGHPKTYTMSLRVLSKCCFISVRLGALVSLGRQYSRWGCSRAEQSRTITYLDWLLMLCLKISLSLTSLRDERFLVPLICWLCWSKWAFFSRKIMPWKMFVSHFTVLFMLHFTIRQ